MPIQGVLTGVAADMEFLLSFKHDFDQGFYREGERAIGQAISRLGEAI
jgi:hypothetical protein